MNTFMSPVPRPAMVLSPWSLGGNQGGDAPDASRSLNRLANILRRRRWLILACATLALVLGAVAGLTLPPVYTARALILIKPPPDASGATPERADVTATTIETEASDIGSRDQLNRVLDRLATTPGFPISSFGRPGRLRQATHWLATKAETGVLGGLVGAVLSPEKAAALRALVEPPSPQEQRERILDELERNLKVNPEPRSRVISVRYTANHPEVAAQVANAVGAAYFAEQEERKREDIQREIVRLDLQLPDQRKEMEEAAAVIRAYRLDKAVLDPANAELLEQQAVVLKGKINAAQASLDAARRERAAPAGPAPGADPADAKAATLLADARLGEESAMLAARIQGFQRQLDTVQSSLQQMQPAADHLRQLVRLADAKRQIYEADLLLREKLVRQQDLVSPGATTLSAASAPLRPASANPVLFLPPALVVGLLIGGLIALWRETQDTTLRNERSVTALGLSYAGFLPGSEGRGSSRQGQMSDLHAAALRSIVVATTHADSVRQGGKVVLVTSSVSGEDSSGLATGFAYYAAKLRRRVLLINLDLQGTGSLPPAALAQSADSDDSSVPGMVLTRPAPDLPLDLLSADCLGQDPVGFLVGWDLPLRLKSVRENYDCIVIHAGPVLETAEVQLLAGEADRILLAIRWGHTPRHLVENAVALLSGVDGLSIKPGGFSAVLTEVDLQRHLAYRYGDPIEAMTKAFRHRSASSKRQAAPASGGEAPCV